MRAISARIMRCTMISSLRCLVLVSLVAHLAINRLHYYISEYEGGRGAGIASLISSNQFFLLSQQERLLSMTRPQSHSNLLSSQLAQVAPKQTWFAIPASKFVVPIRRPFFELFDMKTKMSDGTCEDDFGFGLIRRWKGSEKEWCNRTIKCYPIQQNQHGGAGDNLCVVQNGTLDLREHYNNETLTREIVRSYRDTQHADMPYIHFKSPVISTRCDKVPSEWKDEVLPGWNGDWLGAGLDIKSQKDCQNYERKPLLIIQRDEFANFYHDSEDFFNAFLALMVIGLRPDEVRVMLGDLYPWGPYADFWRHLFPDVKTAWEMREMEPTCYSKIFIGIYGPASPLTLINQVTTCNGSPLVKAYARWVWSSFGIHAPKPTGAKNQTVKVLWMSRKSSVLWPEQRYCDDRYFKCADWTHLGVRVLGRVIANEDEIVAVLKTNRHLDVLHADYNKLPFAEQIRQDHLADVMAGPHGAGLTHLLFLSDTSCVFEVFVDGSESNLHYINMAVWRGVAYGSIIANNPVGVREVVETLAANCLSKFLPEESLGFSWLQLNETTTNASREVFTPAGVTAGVKP